MTPLLACRNVKRKAGMAIRKTSSSDKRKVRVVRISLLSSDLSLALLATRLWDTTPSLESKGMTYLIV